LSVIIRFGMMPCLVSNRLAALVLRALDDLVEHIAVLIDGLPQPVLLAGDGDSHLVQMPHVAPAGLLALEVTGVVRAELLCPTADRFAGNDNAAFHQHFIRQDTGSAETESRAKQHGR